jgi:hypothetical protein
MIYTMFHVVLKNVYKNGTNCIELSHMAVVAVGLI